MDYWDYNIFPVEFLVDVNTTTPKIKLCDFLNWDALYGFPPLRKTIFLKNYKSVMCV